MRYQNYLFTAERKKGINHNLIRSLCPSAFVITTEEKGDIYDIGKVSGNWRITFRFERGDAYGVDYVDYH